MFTKRGVDHAIEWVRAARSRDVADALNTHPAQWDAVGKLVEVELAGHADLRARIEELEANLSDARCFVLNILYQRMPENRVNSLNRGKPGELDRQIEVLRRLLVKAEARVEELEATLARIVDELSDPTWEKWCDSPEPDRRLLENLLVVCNLALRDALRREEEDDES